MSLSRIARAGLCSLLVLVVFGGKAATVEAADPVTAGRRIYREGILPSGRPLVASFLGGHRVEGRRAACIQCHQRSGLGVAEGRTGTLPITGKTLFAARERGYRPRPAYTEATLAHAIRDRVDSAGVELDHTMPTYELADDAMEALVAYLTTLSQDLSPGVSEDEIHLATVITDEVPVEAQRAMMDVLETFFRDKGAQTRREGRRAERGAYYRDRVFKAYRDWVLHPWYLSGPPESWPAQLGEHYRKHPVFALVSGISTLPWQPVHDFCEAQGIPCLLPNTDLPGEGAGDDFYTLYFSEGLVLEARTVLEHASNDASAERILQVFRDVSAGRHAAVALRRLADQRKDGPSVVDWSLPPDFELTEGAVRERAASAEADAVVFWLGAQELDALARSSAGAGRPYKTYVSSTFLDGDLSLVPPTLRPTVLVVHPYSLPADRELQLRRVGVWLRSRGIEKPHQRIQAQTYFACLIAAEGMAHVRRLFYRDYLLDSLDHGEGMTGFSTFHPRLSFGPGQRFLAKGSYVVELAEDSEKAGVSRATWIVPDTDAKVRLAAREPVSR